MSLMRPLSFFVLALLAFTACVGDADADADADLVTDNVDVGRGYIYSAADDATAGIVKEEHRNHLRQSKVVAMSNEDIAQMNYGSFDHQNDHLRSLSHHQDGDEDAREGDLREGRKLGRNKRRRRHRRRRRRRKQKRKNGKKHKKKKYTQYDYPIGNCGGHGYSAGGCYQQSNVFHRPPMCGTMGSMGKIKNYCQARYESNIYAYSCYWRQKYYEECGGYPSGGKVWVKRCLPLFRYPYSCPVKMYPLPEPYPLCKPHGRYPVYPQKPTPHPTKSPTGKPTNLPTAGPTRAPTKAPTKVPTGQPTDPPTVGPTTRPSHLPSFAPSDNPSLAPSSSPSDTPSRHPSYEPSLSPSSSPSNEPSPPSDQLPPRPPTAGPTTAPSAIPSFGPSPVPSRRPSFAPSYNPSDKPSLEPSSSPSDTPSRHPSNEPSLSPSSDPSALPSSGPSTSSSPSDEPSDEPSRSSSPSNEPSAAPSSSPSNAPSSNPSDEPSLPPSNSPSDTPSNSPSDSFTPSDEPSLSPSSSPSDAPSSSPSEEPSLAPSRAPSDEPSRVPSSSPSVSAEPSRSNSPTLRCTSDDQCGDDEDCIEGVCEDSRICSDAKISLCDLAYRAASGLNNDSGKCCPPKSNCVKKDWGTAATAVCSTTCGGKCLGPKGNNPQAGATPETYCAFGTSIKNMPSCTVIGAGAVGEFSCNNGGSDTTGNNSLCCGTGFVCSVETPPTPSYGPTAAPTPACVDGTRSPENGGEIPSCP